MRKPIFLLLFFVLHSPLLAQRIYNFYYPGDWVSYTNTRYVTSIGRGFNTVYFGTTGGILRYDRSREQWLDPITVSDGLPDNRIRKLIVDRLTDEIWVETPVQLSYHNPTFGDWTMTSRLPQEPTPNNRARIEDLPQLFVPHGFSYFASGVVMDRNLLEYPITQMYRDDDQTVWAGLWGLGPAQIDLIRNDLKMMPQGLYDDDVARLLIDGNEVWFLGGGGGLPGAITLFNRKDGSWKYFDARYERGIISDQFYALAVSRRSVWIGTELGLVRGDRRTHTFRSYSHFDGIYGERVTAILPIENNVLIGTDRGVSVFDLVLDSIYSATSPNMEGRIVLDFEARDRRIFAATDNGIYELAWSGSYWQRFDPSIPTLNTVIYDLQIVDSLLYALSEDGLVVVSLADSTYTLHDRYASFRGASLYVLLVHEGVIWVGGDDGLFRHNQRRNTWYRYTQNDGLISMRVTSLAPDGEYLWIGTDRGASRFYWKDFERSDWLQ